MLKMSKRFADSDKYKKGFIRNLPAAYKIFWDYICLDCNHAGIWQVDFEVAQIYIGQDAPVDCKTALELFNQGEERIIVLNGGSKWFIQPFIDFQYGALNPENRVHFSVLKVLNKYEIKHLVSSLQGAMDKDMDKDKDLDKNKDKETDNSWKLFIAYYFEVYQALTGADPLLVDMDWKNLKGIKKPLAGKEDWRELLKTAMENCYKKAKESKGSRFEIRFETTELYKHFADYCTMKGEYSTFERGKL